MPESRNDNTATIVLAEVETYTQSLSALEIKAHAACSNRETKELEKQGRDLWNLCLRLVRERSATWEGTAGRKLLLKVRVLAFRMLAFSHRNSDQDQSAREATIAYLLSLALTTARYCAQAADIEAGKSILLQAEGYLKQVTAISLNDSSLKRFARHEVEYLTMRMAFVSTNDFRPSATF